MLSDLLIFVENRHVSLSFPFSLQLQAMHANTSVANGMKGASTAMAAMNKVWEMMKINRCRLKFFLLSLPCDLKQYTFIVRPS